MHKPRTHLFRNGTYFNTLVCSAEHDQGFPIHLRQLIFKVLSTRDDDALTELHDTLLESDDIGFQAWAGTTQALGITGGGVKVNALPTKAFAVANHRIADWRSVYLQSLSSAEQGDTSTDTVIQLCIRDAC